MTLFIDSREKQYKLAQELATKVDVKYLLLDAGDFLIPLKDNTNILFERMTILDFLGKVQSKRLENQIFKMRQVTQNYYIIIENLWLLKKTKWNQHVVHKMIAAWSEHNKIMLAPTPVWSFNYIMYFYNKYATDRELQSYETRAKPKRMTVVEQAAFALCGIEGIGKSTAMKLLEHFGSVYGITKADIDELSVVVNGKLAKHLYEVMHTEIK